MIFDRQQIAPPHQPWYTQTDQNTTQDHWSRSYLDEKTFHKHGLMDDNNEKAKLGRAPFKQVFLLLMMIGRGLRKHISA